MLLSAVSVLVVAQSSSEIPEGLMNNPVVWEEQEDGMCSGAQVLQCGRSHCEQFLSVDVKPTCHFDRWGLKPAQPTIFFERLKNIYCFSVHVP